MELLFSVSLWRGDSIGDDARLGERARNHSNSVHFQPCHQQVVWHSIHAEEAPDLPEPPRLGKSLLAIEYDSLEEEAGTDVEGLKGKSICNSEDAIAAKGFGGLECAKHSMANLLGGLQENCAQYVIPKRVLLCSLMYKYVAAENGSMDRRFRETKHFTFPPLSALQAPFKVQVGLDVDCCMARASFCGMLGNLRVLVD